MSIRMLWLVVLALGVTTTASPQAPRSTVRTPQLENDAVRVWKTSIAPGQPLTLHRHENRGHGRGDEAALKGL